MPQSFLGLEKGKDYGRKFDFDRKGGEGEERER